MDANGYYAYAGAASQETWSLTLRDGDNRLATDYTVTSSGTTRKRSYFYFGNLLVATREESGAVWRFYASDHLGTPRVVTSSTGSVLETHKYKAFGEEIGGTFGIQPLKFAGMERDAASANDYDHARYMNGTLGRFLSPDKLQGKVRDPQSWNRYAYARNNPLKLVDPNGLDLKLAPGLSNRDVRFIRKAFTGLVRRPSGRSLFQRLEADPRAIIVSVANLNDPNDIRVARFTRNAVNLTFGETTFRHPVTGAVRMSLDVNAIREFARRTNGAIDPGGITTSGHEMFHANAALNADVSAFRGGDLPTSATGPAQQFGEDVFEERPDMGKSDAAAIVDAALAQEQHAVQSLDELQRASCFFSGLCSGFPAQR